MKQNLPQNLNSTINRNKYKGQHWLALIALLAISWVPCSARAQGGTRGISTNDGQKVVHRLRPPRGEASGTATGGSGPDLSYHGGPLILGTIYVYYIWYGDWSGTGASKTSNLAAQNILTHLATFIAPSPYFNINTTYSDGGGTRVSNSVVYAGSFADNYSKGKALSDTDVQNIVANAINPSTPNHLPTDINGVYFVLASADVDATSGFCTQYCGWHTTGTISGSDIKYSFVGDGDRCPSQCEAQYPTSPNGNSGADGMASVIAHELEESATDPDISGWYGLDALGQIWENGDKCAWTFGSTYTTSNGSRANMKLGGFDYLIQQNWVNTGGGFCALSKDTPSTVSITSPANNAAFTAPANITITATAADSDGTISKVDFYANSMLIRTSTASPYSLTWNKVPAGSYTLSAVATDNAGLTTTSAPINITVRGGSAYTLTASPSTVAAGRSLTISWTAPSGRPSTDWIGLHEVGNPNTSYTWWKYTNGTSSGSFTLSAPNQAGQYEFRYFTNNSFTKVATSNPVTVTSGRGGGSYSLTASPSTVAAGRSLTISWTAPSGRPSTDWIGLHEVGNPNTSYTWWKYTGGASSGSFNLTAPSQAGQYEFRYLLQNGFTIVAKSNTVVVQ